MTTANNKSNLKGLLTLFPGAKTDESDSYVCLPDDGFPVGDFRAFVAGLAKLVAPTKVTLPLPSGGPDFTSKHIVIKRLVADFANEEFSLEVGWSESWKIINAHGFQLEVGEPSLVLAVAGPATDRYYRALLDGQLKLAGATFDIEADLVAQTLTATLQQPSPPATLSLEGWLEQFGARTGTARPFDHLIVAGASLVLNLSPMAFIIAADIQDPFTVGGFELANLSFSFFHSFTSEATSVSLTARAWIGRLALSVTASYDSAGKQWSFAGSATEQFPVPVQEILSGLNGMLGTQWNVSDSLKDAFVRDVLMTIQIADDQPTFQFSLVFDVGAWEICASFEHGKGDGSTKSEGEVTAALGDLTFTFSETSVSGPDGTTLSLGIFALDATTDAVLDLGTLFSLLQIDNGFASGVSIGLSDAAIVRFSQKSETDPLHGWVFAAKLSGSLDLSEIPIAGALVSGDGTLKVDGLTAFGASTAVPPAIVAALQGQLADFPVPDALPKGASFGGTVTIGGGAHDFHALSPDVTAPAPGATDPPPASNNGARWFNVQKSLGLLSIRRVGLELRKDATPQLGILIDAGFQMSVLTLDLDALEVTVPLSSPPSPPTFGLRGLELDYRSGPVTISGGFLDVTPPPGIKCQFEGEALIQTSALSLSAWGEYAQLTNGDVSVAIFAVLDYPLGGPAFAFVTGLAAGFGYNSHLTLPATTSELAQFPLLQAAQPGSGQAAQPGSGASLPESLSGGLSKCITPTPGAIWLTAGVMFRSFEMIETLALLTIELGKEFQVALFGRSQMSIPPAAPETLAYAELDVMATFDPQAGALSVLGVLSPNSWVIAPECRLSGGFAFCLWESGKFVVTYGGYNPKFDYAAQGFPAVPRLQIHWQLDSHTQIKGTEYFALTGGAMMAGGGLEATWQSGVFSASFTASADFLMEWRPFHFEGDFSISLAAAFTLNIAFITVHFSFHLGVALHLEGPPLYGTAEIDLSVVSFTVTFGRSNPEIEPLQWADFLKLLPGYDPKQPNNLPAPKARVLAGLVGEYSGTGRDTELGAINPKELLIQIETVAPVNTLTHNAQPIKPKWNVVEHARPMRASITASDLALTLERRDSRSQEFQLCHDGLTFSPVLETANREKREAPAALWGKPSSTDLSTLAIKNVLTVVHVCPSNPSVDSTDDVDVANLAIEADPLDERICSFAGPQQSTAREATKGDLVAQIENTVSARKDIAEDLSAAGWALSDHLNDGAAAKAAAAGFWEQPRLMPLS